MYNSSPSLSPPTTECQHGWYLNSEDLHQKVSEIPRMAYPNRRIYQWTLASYQGWFANETTVRNSNYSVEPVATAFFNDPFYWLFGEKKKRIIFSIFSCCLCKILNEFTAPRVMAHHPFLFTTSYSWRYFFSGTNYFILMHAQPAIMF